VPVELVLEHVLGKCSCGTLGDYKMQISISSSVTGYYVHEKSSSFLHGIGS
jgi:hypothetical protein